MSDSLEKIRGELATALERNLETEARARGLEAPAGLFTAVAADPGSRVAAVRAFFGERAPLALVGFDTPGLQEYVFKVQRPVDLLGGSQIIDDFTDPAILHSGSLYRHLEGAGAAVPASTVIYAGGGGGLLLVAASEAPRLAETLADVLSQATRGDLRTAVAMLELWPEDLGSAPAESLPGLEEVLGPLRKSSRYAAAVATLNARLQHARSAGARLAEPIPPERHRERCQACGHQIATSWRTEGLDREQLCAACEARWRHGQERKHSEEQPRSFEDLVQGLPETSLAVLYADGANAGRAFQSVETPAQHRALSQAVDLAITTARDQVLCESPWLTAGKGFRAQTPICGGDDLVMVLPAVAVFDALPQLVDSFEQTLDREVARVLPEIRLGLGIGIAIADFHFPIQFLVGYARELLKSAKKRIHAGTRSAVDFLVLRSGTPLSQSIAELRRRHAQKEPADGEPGLVLTRRPYDMADFRALLHRTQMLGKHVPPAQLHAIRREIGRGHALSRSLWRYQHARSGKGKGWAAYRGEHKLAEVDDLLWWTVAPPAGCEGRWVATDFLDALEIFDLANARPPKGATT